jgi:transcriptional regulator with XRE-family HTH domain
VEGDLQHILGSNVRANRLARAMSQEAFADLLGVHRTYIGAIERGDKNLSLRSVERLAERLGVQPVELLQSAGPSPGPATPVERRTGRRARRSADQR